MSVQRNDPCPCGSGKKYKDCCWKNDMKEGIKRKKKSPIFNLAIQNLRENPLKSDHWEITNAAIDEILKSQLKDSIILKHRPIDWIQPLFHSHFILTYPYWKMVYEFALARETRFTLLYAIPYDTPLYLRIVSLLLRIQCDRLGYPRFDDLPSLPSQIATRPMGTLALSGIPEEGIFKYIDEITNNASKEIRDFLTKCRNKDLKKDNGLTGYILFPIPLYEVKNYIDFLNSLNDIFNSRYHFEEKETEIELCDQNGNPFKIVEYMPEEIVFLRSRPFKKEFIPMVINFLETIYMKFGYSKEVKQMCDYFLYFFRHIEWNAVEPLQAEFIRFEVKLLYEKIPEDLIAKFLYDPTIRNDSLANPLNARHLFQHGLDLFNTPFIKDNRGYVYFSLLWLFDSLVSHLTYLLRKERIGLKRGHYSEKYLMRLLELNIQHHFPSSNFTGTFNLMLKSDQFKTSQKSRSQQIYWNIKEQLKKYDIPSIEFTIPKSILRRRNFIEFDVVFGFYDYLIVIEVKDNLFWSVRDLPDIQFIRKQRQEQILKRKCAILSTPMIKNKLASKRIKYKKIRCVVIDNCHIQHENFKNYKGFINDLAHLEAEIRLGKKIDFYLRILEILYPT